MLSHYPPISTYISFGRNMLLIAWSEEGIVFSFACERLRGSADNEGSAGLLEQFHSKVPVFFIYALALKNGHRPGHSLGVSSPKFSKCRVTPDVKPKSLVKVLSKKLVCSPSVAYLGFFSGADERMGGCWMMVYRLLGAWCLASIGWSAGDESLPPVVLGGFRVVCVLPFVPSPILSAIKLNWRKKPRENFFFGRWLRGGGWVICRLFK